MTTSLTCKVVKLLFWGRNFFNLIKFNMTLPAHIASGYLISKVYCNNLGLECKDPSLFTTLTIVGSLLPDVDGLFGGYLKDHRNTPFHSPLFWLFILLISYAFGFLFKYLFIQNYIIALSIGAFFHLFLDWFSGRAAGIRIFYPFSKKVYSLFPLNPEKGKVSIIPTTKEDIKKYIEFVKFFFENRFLVATEITIILTAILVWWFEK